MEIDVNLNLTQIIVLNRWTSLLEKYVLNNNMLSFSKGIPIARTPNILSITEETTKPDYIKLSKKCCKKHNVINCLKNYPDVCCNKCSINDSDELINDYINKVGRVTPLPDLLNRFVEYIAGPSGSGKSTMASHLALEYKKAYPNNPIYIFSRTDCNQDPAYKHIKPIQVKIDEGLIEKPIDISKEINGGSLLIFDDCNTILDNNLKKEVDKLMSDAMEIGRKLKCNIIITNHLVIPNEKKMARTLLNELTTMTVFPKSGSSQQIKYALKTYYGLNNKQIDKILGLKSRWVRISKTYPQHVVYQGGAYIL